MTKLVSVLIPAYNHEKFIAEAIQSIVDQTYQNLELIIVDDGSTDLTYSEMQRMKDYCEDRFTRFVVIRQENRGVIATLNLLLETAHGDYVFIMASDDVAKPKTIETLLSFLEENSEYALAVGDNEFIDCDGNIVYLNTGWEKVTDEAAAVYRTLGAALRCEKLGENFGRYRYLYAGNHVPNGYLIRKAILEKTGSYNSSAPLEDWFMNLQISKYSRMKYFSEVLFSYRLHDHNTVYRKDYMNKISNATFEYENTILQNFSKDLMSEDMKDCLNYGIIRKQIDLIPNTFVIMRFKKMGKTRYLVRLLNWKFLI